MKRPSRHCKTPADLLQSVQRQINMYALAASAAGVSVLALTPPAVARIIYTPIHHVIGKNSSFYIDLNHDGIAEFLIINSAFRVSQASVNLLRALPNHDESAGVAGAFRSPDTFAALALKRGTRISSAQRLYSRGDMAGQCAHNTNLSSFPCNSRSHNTTGYWVNVTDRYLGLMFTLHGKVHYGWARLSVQASKRRFTLTATLTGFAYETIPGKSIKAGQIKEGAVDSSNDGLGSCSFLNNPIQDIPQPASLGALAMGAPGLAIWRPKELVGSMQ
jgi:hypothetical protein